MRFSSETKLFLGIIGATILIIGIAVFAFSRPQKPITKEELVPPTAQTRGNPDASVYLVEFSDFKCPSCGDAKPIVDALVSKYQDRLLFVYRYFPLDQHPFAEMAAEAAAAAGAQGKFWEMYDLLFQNQDVLSQEKMYELAQGLGLDMDRFDQELQDGTYRDTVLADKNEGIRLGINETPTFFLNGYKLQLTSLSDIQTEVEKLMQ
jgi:protein-disulfide isomerase